jgi:hypothetical protein
MKATLVVTLVLASSIAHAQTEPQFDWTLSRGKTTRFVLEFDVCQGRPIPTTVSHTWTIRHSELPGAQKTIGPTNKCKTSVPLQQEGEYVVTVTASLGSVTIPVMVQEWVIVAIGDSYGSGEGNPDQPLQVADWLDSLSDLEAALANLAQVPNAHQIIGLTATAVTRTNDLIHCLGFDRHVGLFGIVYYTPRLCAGELLLGVPVLTTIKLAAINEVIIQINALATRTVFEQISFSFELLNPVNAFKSALTTFQNTVQTLLDAVALAEQVSSDLEAGLATDWLDRWCHRSPTSGPAMAAAELERLDPRTLVRFINLTCSGAQILNGLVHGFVGREPPDPTVPLPPQVLAAVERVAGREVDAILVSIGGNDARFSDIAKSCTVQNPCSDPQVVHFEDYNFTAICAGVAFIPGMFDQCMAYADSLSAYNSATGAMLFNAGLATLPDRYRQLHDALVDGFPVLASAPRRVLITEYPDTSQDALGNVCGLPTVNPLDNFPGMTIEEWTWVGNTMTPALNGAVHAAAMEHGWTFVDGIFGDFASHGYCSSNNWFVRLQDSFLLQGDQFGTLHPNAAGHAAIAQRILASLRPQLYQNGNLSRPRRPLLIEPAARDHCQRHDQRWRRIRRDMDQTRGHGPLRV